MAKAPDIGSKRLVSLAPMEWVRWLTMDTTVDEVELVSVSSSGSVGSTMCC